jgi:glycine cleavage system H protein
MVPQNLYYTKDHEWAEINGDVAIIGITDYAQQSLGEITYVELPAVKKQVKAHDILAVVESSKAASDVYSPLAGAVLEVNNELGAKPELINQDCYKAGWICKIKAAQPASTRLGEVGPDIKNLMNAEKYEQYLKSL